MHFILVNLLEVLSGIVVLILAFLLRRRLRPCKVTLDALPWIGIRKGEIFGKTRAGFREWTNAYTYLDEGYAKYSQHGRAWVTPTTTQKPEVLLPPQHISWLVRQPDSVLNVFRVRNAIMGLDHTTPPEIAQNRLQNDVLQKGLTRQLGLFTPDVAAEMHDALEELWSTQVSEWREIKVYETIESLVIRGVMRVFVGEPLCRNKEYLRAMEQHMTNLILFGVSFRFLPSFLRPIVAPLASLPSSWHMWTCLKHLTPLIEEYIASIKAKEPLKDMIDTPQRVGTIGNGREENHTVLFKLVRAAYSQADSNPCESSPSVIALRLHLLIFAAIHTTTFTLTNALFDLAAQEHPPGSPPVSQSSTTAFSLIHNEAKAHFSTAAPAFWSRAALHDLPHTTSALLETLRYIGLGGRGLMHEVLPPEGVTPPSGQKLPQGTWVGAPVGGVHHDKEIYGADANIWRAERWYNGESRAPAPSIGSGVMADQKEENNATEKESEEQPQADGRADVKTAKKKPSLVTTTPTFLAFGHGRNACPGRFFAAHQLKLALTSIALRYEIQYKERPKVEYLSDFILPPMKETLFVRRRKESAE